MVLVIGMLMISVALCCPMQLQNYVLVLQVDRSKPHALFSILWSISLAWCWYSWGRRLSSLSNACITLTLLNSANRLRIVLSVKDDTHNLISVPGFSASFFPPSNPLWTQEWRWFKAILASVLDKLDVPRTEQLTHGHPHF